MQSSGTVSPRQTEIFGEPKLGSGSSQFVPDRVLYALYALTLAGSIAIWFIAFRSPLWLDETVSIYLIKGGLKGILSRQVWPDSPAYSCLLWLWTKAISRGELMLRISSLLPMLGAVYLLYQAARQLFSRDVALIAAILFCLDPIIIFAAIDVRPYAFAALAINASILTLVCLRQNNSNWLAALFGFSAAWIVEFQLLFAVILPALGVCFVLLKLGDRKTLWRQLGIALAVFAVGCLPAVHRLQYMAHTSTTHVFSQAPTLLQLLSTLTLGGLALVLVLAAVAAAVTGRLTLRGRSDGWVLFLCTSLALVPGLTLYALSVGTSIHVFVPRYRLVAVPGIALCWALVASWLDSRLLRWLACATVLAATATVHGTRPSLRQHQYSWKYALDVVEKNASVDNAPVLICSDIPESDYMRMPVGSAIEDSGILPPLSYYPLTVPVVPLPRTLNAETVRTGSHFLQQTAQRRQRFLAAAFAQSWDSLNWLAKHAAADYQVQELGEYDGVKVLEFVPARP